MKRFSTSLLLLLIMAPVFCQVMMNDSLKGDREIFLQPKKVSYGVTVGSQFTSVSGFGSALSTYITPRVSYNINNRLSIGGGLSLVQTNYFKTRAYFQNESASGSGGNYTSGTIFIEGNYLVNDRLTIYGSAFKQFPISQQPLTYNPYNPLSSQNAQGIDLNVAYKLGEHVFIQAGFRYSDGVNPYYADPFNRHSFMNEPFGSQPGFGAPRW